MTTSWPQLGERLDPKPDCLDRAKTARKRCYSLCNSRYLKGTGFLDVLGFKSLSIR